MDGWSRSSSEDPQASSGVKILVVHQGGHISTLVHDPEDDRSAIRSVELLEEDHVPLAVYRPHAWHEEAPVPTNVGLPGDPLKRGDQLAVVDEPLFPAPGPDGVVADIFEVGPCQT